MIPKECKRLAEVDFPIAVVSKHAVAENSIRYGHPKTLHLWWARRPLAACRAILLGLLLPDPCDETCPQEFKDKVRILLPKVQGTVPGGDSGLRQALLKFIGDFANWDLSADRTYLEISRGLIKAAHGEEPPLVVDSFAGGGSIPLEALRVGCDAFASDINPIACLILQSILENIPRHGSYLAEELERVSNVIESRISGELHTLYPPDPDGAQPIAYLWARTVHCESPNCGLEIPLVRSFWLRKKGMPRQAIRYHVLRSNDNKPRIEFETFEPQTESEVPAATIFQAKATCPACKAVIPPNRIREQLVTEQGGLQKIRLVAVVTQRPSSAIKSYRTAV